MISENNRIQSLIDYQILDTLPEREFDDIVELASAFFHTPISLISLLDSQRQWFKARVGLQTPETPIEYAFCYHAIKEPNEVMVVADSFKDERFQNNPLVVGGPHIRFYAGAPLLTGQGNALGTLCVIDNQPRSFSDEQKRVLKILAQKVIERLEFRKQSIEAQEQIRTTNNKLELTLKRLLDAEGIAQIGNWSLDTSTGLIYWSPEMYQLFDVKDPEQAPVTLGEWIALIHPDDLPSFQKLFELNIENRRIAYQCEFKLIDKNKGNIWMAGRSIVDKDTTDKWLIKGIILNITERKTAETNKEQYIIALEEMLFALSHKIRKPVANVLGMMNALHNKDISEDDRLQCITYLKTSAEELDQYIHELNDFTYQKKVKIKR